MVASVPPMRDSVAARESFRGHRAFNAVENADRTISCAAVSLRRQNPHSCKCWN